MKPVFFCYSDETSCQNHSGKLSCFKKYKESRFQVDQAFPLRDCQWYDVICDELLLFLVNSPANNEANNNEDIFWQAINDLKDV